MKLLLAILPVAFSLLIVSQACYGQHTFSIVAFDPVTGEVGSAGASCIGIDVRIISDVHPGVGVVHTQAFWNQKNQNYGRELMNLGLPPQSIIDSLVAYDAEGTSELRQYGVVTLAGNLRAAFTGTDAFDYKSHIIGPTYTIQGNTLLGQKVLDSMAAHFNRASGSLADRLMAALEGARMPGADNRCSEFSSMGAFLRVARPGDRVDSLYLDLTVTFGLESSEPIDSLRTLYNHWLGTTGGVETKGMATNDLRLDIRPDGSGAGRTISYSTASTDRVVLTLFDAAGRMALRLDRGVEGAGNHVAPVEAGSLTPGVYFCRLDAGNRVATRKFVVDGRNR